MSITAYHLTPRGPMHFGGRGAGVESTSVTCPADTLFGAVCHALREREGRAALEAMLDRFVHRDPPFLLSSLLPRVGTVRLVPRPMVATRYDPTASVPTEGVRKQGKRLRYLSWDLTRRALDGDPVPAPDASGGTVVGGDGAPLRGYVAWLTPEERARLVVDGLWVADGARVRSWWEAGRETRVPRVTVDRQTGASEIFHAGRVLFRPGCGLYLLVRWRDASWRPRLEAILDLLSDSGIGGERSIGHGQFDVDAAIDVEEPDASTADGFVTLAPYCPTEGEISGGILDRPGAWDLATHGGWIGTPGVALRQRTVTMLAEGSALRAPDIAAGAVVFGAAVNVTPSAPTFRSSEAFHEVYRYGYAFPWPAVLEEAAR